ncbi:hypothetical protein M9Y10_007079 [Tritrichomonas musculus]|uniref:Uncharacterized protein n=1 Tax=Tritrichomonas musculus TaxID=1915356 RepID=A0ABR2J2A4_9EUKA
MNLTILAFISPALLSHSSIFVCNHLSVIDSKFNKFFPTLFYNQQSLFLKNSQFTHGLSGVILKTSNNDQKTFYDEVFDSKSYKEGFKDVLLNIQYNRSITIMGCSFIKISASDGIEYSTIQINGKYVSLYMTDNIFNSCKSNQGVIRLEMTRCISMSHTCSFQSECQSKSAFLNCHCEPDDFFINIYNTIVDSKKSSTQQSIFNSFCNSGNQYYRCNNMTGVPFGGYQFDAPRCMSFAMITVMNCDESCFFFSGYQGECDKFTSKTIKMVNFFANNNVIRISSTCVQTITVQDSVLLSKGESNNIVHRDQQNCGITIELQNCIITSQQVESYISITGCSTVSYDTKYLTIYPHFTNGDLCRGTHIPNENAHGCNAGNCFDGDTCNNTIGFPDGVPTYTTFIHTDIQTASFTPTNKFSRSNPFSQSFPFTYSGGFSDSTEFSKSNYFSNSDKFTKSFTFSESNKFSKTDDFTQSTAFSGSSIFTQSNHFSNSPSFSKSGKFSATSQFTETSAFSRTADFTKSSKFSASLKFTETNPLKRTSKFTSSGQFTRSNTFTKSCQFTESDKFTKSGLFTPSDHFTRSDEFTKSDLFTPSDHFTRSDKFTESHKFSSSEKFSHSEPPVGAGGSQKDKAKTIGIIAGSVGGTAAVAAAIAAFFLIRRRKPKIEDVHNFENTAETVNVENDLDNIMDEDDPFADEFI